MLFLGRNTNLDSSKCCSSHSRFLQYLFPPFSSKLYTLSPNSHKMATQKKCCANFLENSKHYFAMIALQFGYAGMNIITKVSLNRGMSHYVLVVYRHVFATAVVAPFALIFERFIAQTCMHMIYLFFYYNKSIAKLMHGFIFHRKAQPRITFTIFMQIFILALLGLVP